jgi:hypothetical protein
MGSCFARMDTSGRGSIFPKDDSVFHATLPKTTMDVSALKTSLNGELATGFERITFQDFDDVGLDSICLWRSDGSGLEFYSALVELPAQDAYCEVGVLCVGYPDPALSLLRGIDLPEDFAFALSPLTLTVVENGTTFESALVLRGRSGSQLTIVSGAFPFTVEITSSL